MTQQDREDFTIMKYDIKQTKEDVVAIKDNSERLNKEFAKLMIHLIGDKEVGLKGWIQKVTRFDYRLTIVERSIAVGGSAVLAFGSYLVFIKNIFSIFTE